MTESNGSAGMTDRHAEPLVDEFQRLSARMGVSDEMLPVEIVLKVVGRALGRSDRETEALRREVETLRSKVVALEARLDARP